MTIEPIEIGVGQTRLIVRELAEDDLDALVSYWHESPRAYLLSLGADLARVGGPEDTRARLSAGMNEGPRRRAVTLTTVLDGDVVAYLNAHVVTPGVGVGHFHTLRHKPAIIAASFKLFKPVCEAIMRDLHITTLRFNAAPENRGINAYLRTFGLVPRRVHVEQPEGVGRVGEFNVYEIAAGAVPSLD